MALSSSSSCAALRAEAEAASAYGMTLRPSDAARLARGRDGIEGACAAGSIAWIVPVDGGVVLVDAGFEDDGARIRAALGPRRRVLAILLTHAHLDHRAAAASFAGAPVYVGRADVPLLDGSYAYPHFAGAVLSAFGVPPLPRTVIPVDDGFALVVGGRTFRALAVPGHTPGSIAWRAGRSLFTGDAALSPFGDALAPSPEGYSDDDVRAWTSLERAAARVGADVDEVLDGHFGRTALTPAVWARSWRREHAMLRVHDGAVEDAAADGAREAERPWGCAPAPAR